MSADVKANIKEQEIKDLVAYLTKKYLQNLYSILFGIPFFFTFSVMNRSWGLGVCLMDKI